MGGPARHSKALLSSTVNDSRILDIVFLILTLVSQDIRNQRRYRQRRKAELVKLQQTYAALNSKATFYGEQVDYYKSYIKTCLDNLASKGK